MHHFYVHLSARDIHEWSVFALSVVLFLFLVVDGSFFLNLWLTVLRIGPGGCFFTSSMRLVRYLEPGNIFQLYICTL